MSYFFHQDPVRDMLIAEKRLRETEGLIREMESILTKKKVDRDQLKIYIRNHKKIL